MLSSPFSLMCVFLSLLSLSRMESGVLGLRSSVTKLSFLFNSTHRSLAISKMPAVTAWCFLKSNASVLNSLLDKLSCKVTWHTAYCFSSALVCLIEPSVVSVLLTSDLPLLHCATRCGEPRDGISADIKK